MNPLKKIKLSGLRKKVQTNAEQREAGNAPVLQDECQALFALAAFYHDNRDDTDIPYAELLSRETYRAAASLGDTEAQYLCGQLFLDTAKFWTDFANGMLGNNIHQQYAHAHYQEAFFYLDEAKQAGHALATRLRGMTYIRGWGEEKNTDRGFELIVKSIELQNAWDKATQIFTELGLNSPEFFSALVKFKK